MFNKGSNVSWKWGKGIGRGTIAEVYTEPVSVEIKGTLIRRKASEANPGYLIQQANGNIVLKLDSQLQK